MRILRLLCLLWAGVHSFAQPLRWLDIPGELLTRRLSSTPIKNEDRGARLEEMFKEAGCVTDQLKRDRVNKKWDNIVCTLPGKTDEVIVIGARYDHAERGDGVVDNWSGSSLLPSLYQGLAALQRRFTYVFVGFAEEEKGLYGARAFVKNLGKADLSNVKAMVNIDSVGMTPPKVWLTRSDKRLVQMIARISNSTKIRFQV